MMTNCQTLSSVRIEMKPGKNDSRHQVFITGKELKELKRHTYMLVEASGLDNRIEQYQGKRPISFYRWDLECLLDSIDSVLSDAGCYPSQNSPEYLSLRSLGDRLQKIYDDAYSSKGKLRHE